MLGLAGASVKQLVEAIERALFGGLVYSGLLALMVAYIRDA
jgi:hypothetical protein